MINWKRSGKVLVQGLVSHQVLDTVIKMRDMGVKIVAGVDPGKGNSQLADIPLFDLVEEAIASVGRIETSLIFVPPYRVLDAAREAIASKIKQIVIFTSGVPPLDTIRLLKNARSSKTLVLGPGSGGILIPQTYNLSILEPCFYPAGDVALIHDSPWLSYEVVQVLKKLNLGVSTLISLGSDNILGSNCRDWIETLIKQEKNQRIILTLRQERIDIELADYLSSCTDKMLITYIYNYKGNCHYHQENALKVLTRRLAYPESQLSVGPKPTEILAEASASVAYSFSQISQILQE